MPKSTQFLLKNRLALGAEPGSGGWELRPQTPALVLFC